MARYQIIYWQHIPSMVEARGEDGVHKVELSLRFQQLIDLVAMKQGLAGTDAYLQQWQKSRRKNLPGGAIEVAQKVSQQLEQQFESVRATALQQTQQTTPEQPPPGVS